MNKITNFQLYCILLIMIGPVSYLEQPHILIHSMKNDSWLGIIASIIPGLLITFMFSSIISKSRHPFPLLLLDHLGKTVGRAIGFIYIPVFILVSAYTLRLFIEFMKMNVLPATPISVFIAVLLVVGFAAIKSGLPGIARLCELIVFAGLPLGFIIIVVSIFSGFNGDRLLPLGHSNLMAWVAGTASTTSVLGKMMPVLSLAYYLPEKRLAGPIMRQTLYLLIPLIALTSLGVVVTRGVIPSMNFTFPTFSMIRLARIGAFVQNIDILFVGILIAGIAGAVIIPWYMACFISKELLYLSDYRFIAAPSALIIGILAVLISGNNLEVVIWSITIAPVLYAFFFIVIPLLVFLLTLFRPVQDLPGDDNRPSNKPSALG